jgi:hypothetical protein
MLRKDRGGIELTFSQAQPECLLRLNIARLKLSFAGTGAIDYGEKTVRYGLFAGAMLLAFAVASTSQAQGRRDRDKGGDDSWERLGCTEVGRRTDFDEIRVGRREGRFKAIRLEASGNSVSILDLKVIYSNGAPDDIQVRSEINEGDRSRPLDLRGRERTIDSIQLISKRDFRGPGRGRAQVCVYGLKDDDRGDRREGGRADWVELGCQSVGLLGDRDVIRVGRREGRFKSIKLNVSGNAVHILDLKVVYTNGDPDDIQVRSEIREGGETRPLDLRGRERAIDRVEMIYRAKPNFKGRARICVSGLQD